MTLNLLTMEESLHGNILPSWLMQSLIDRSMEKVLIVYPNEVLRNNVLMQLADVGIMVDTTMHSTYSRLVDLLHLDSGKEARLDSDGPAFSIIHSELVKAASEEKFLLLHPNKEKNWSKVKTERTLRLLQEIKSQGPVSNWKEGPNLIEVDRVIKGCEKKLAKIHSMNMESSVIDYLETSEDKPFSLSSLEGILILSHEPDFNIQQKKVFNGLRRFTPIHLMSTRGSYVNGFHGAWIDDIYPVASEEELPDWVPSHAVEDVQGKFEWNVPESTSFLKLDDAGIQFDATIELLTSWSKRSEKSMITIIDPGLESRRDLWRSNLAKLGFSSSFSGGKLSSSPAVNAFLSHAKMTISNDAWSLENIIKIAKSTSMPLNFSSLRKLKHPINDDIKVRFHQDIMENISRNFHIKGGISAINQWFTALEVASPEGFIGDIEKNSMKIEETQWWLANIAMLWWPLIPAQERDYISEIIGNYSQSALPLVEKSESCLDWFSKILGMVDWKTILSKEAEYDNSVSGLQHLSRELNRSLSLHEKASLEPDLSADGFSEFLHSIAEHSKSPNGRVVDTDVLLLTPREAIGMKGNIAIFCFMDVESWTMKLPAIAWLDNESRSKLGLPLGDHPLRQARYYLANLTASFDEIIVLDTSEDEGVGPCAPLVEWMNNVESTGLIPSFITTDDLEEPHSPWSVSTEGNLKYSPSGFYSDSDGEYTKQAGSKPRNHRQRLGLALKNGREESWIDSDKSVIVRSQKKELWLERIKRHPQQASGGAVLAWSEVKKFATTGKLTIIPDGKKVNEDLTVVSDEWPNLGGKSGKSTSMAVDPRPIGNFNDKKGIFGTISAPTSGKISDRKWSASRLESWMKCPRSAWLEKHLRASADEDHMEDVDFRTRGDIIHKLYEALFQKLGVKQGVLSKSPKRLHDSEYNSPQAVWELMLDNLEQIAPWLTRKGAVTHHRCIELCGITPGELEVYWSGGDVPKMGGKIGRMVDAEFLLTNCAPLATEWNLGVEEGTKIEAKNDLRKVESIRISGYIDRIDEVILPDESMELVPEKYREKRLIVIRDIKSVQGPKPEEERKKHEVCVLSDLQLAIYTAAFETQNPEFKVIGAGISQIGDSVKHYLEFDSEFESILEFIEIGSTTDFTKNIFRYPDSKPGPINEHFSAWKESRLTTALRARNTALSGQVHPTPGSACLYCSVKDMCGLSEMGEM